MKRFLAFLILALALGLVLGPWVKSSAGYVILVLGDPNAEHTTIRLRLWFALVSIILTVFIVLALWRSLSHAGGWLVGGTGLSARARQRKARKQTVAGMIALAEGHWEKAEQQLVAGAAGAEVPLLCYLMAAQAAQMQKADDRRDEYLRQAALAEPDAQVAVGLTQAQLQLRQGQKELALATLHHVRSLAPKHPYVLRLLKKLHLQFEDWQALRELLPELHKHKLITDQERAELERRAYGALLAREAGRGVEALKAAWAGLDKTIQQHPELLADYAQRLEAAGAGSEAEALLRATLKKRQAAELLLAYTRVRGSDAGKQLSAAEAWLRPDLRSPAQLVGMARLAMRAALWGKARQYLEEALAQKASAEAWWLLAEVHQQTGDQSGAERCYQQGLALAAGVAA